MGDKSDVNQGKATERCLEAKLVWKSSWLSQRTSNETKTHDPLSHFHGARVRYRIHSLTTFKFYPNRSFLFMPLLAISA